LFLILCILETFLKDFEIFKVMTNNNYTLENVLKNSSEKPLVLEPLDRKSLSAEDLEKIATGIKPIFDPETFSLKDNVEKAGELISKFGYSYKIIEKRIGRQYELYINKKGFLGIPKKLGILYMSFLSSGHRVSKVSIYSVLPETLIENLQKEFALSTISYEK